ncbi:DUF3043 domain-containing protein [Couchioplanes caeruleus]|uniref:DUF3043 family protein n=2 Tax=Couchioplanes caeruleus TaxID=56438 RepID=A0A1K0GGL6_9ACTN|nr:DUF3043 domain-containing protein [Couchioplanes caeruleus]OJF11334.1 hypothetical protein BG844_26955 [Couchioplanes caeruleus subsp. caeruleus]ROP29316.1 DUF3043 family protein [Couchioplanes caeruleus]
MPSLFRRKSTDLVADAVEEVTPEPATPRPKGYTPSKKELGLQTPKRQSVQRRHDAVQAPANRREAYKQMRERQRAERAEASAGMRAGDERYLLARDRGPERALVRAIVDSRRTAGTWFFVGAIIVFIGSTGNMPMAVRIGSNVLWAVLAITVIIDSILISRRIKKLVTERFPNTTQRMGSLYLYGIMRGLTFRRMRVPKPQVELGDKV